MGSSGSHLVTNTGGQAGSLRHQSPQRRRPCAFTVLAAVRARPRPPQPPDTAPVVWAHLLPGRHRCTPLSPAPHTPCTGRRRRNHPSGRSCKESRVGYRAIRHATPPPTTFPPSLSPGDVADLPVARGVSQRPPSVCSEAQRQAQRRAPGPRPPKHHSLEIAAASLVAGPFSAIAAPSF
jgi:hypothetical protein